MSVIDNGQRVNCDGQGCAATARVPVALRSVLGAATSDTERPSVYGWLYVIRAGRWSHYCPECNVAYLSSLAALDCDHLSI
ncbi:MAG: hypothetical protein ABIY70_05330 [Capsulimonas sp.]|uniref:hypothetical protein n=1 Tax=Capsulimonas sp. TaxID=2494211 RepID=UPI0032630DA2